MKILRTANLGSNFTGSYKKRVYVNVSFNILPLRMTAVSVETLERLR